MFFIRHLLAACVLLAASLGCKVRENSALESITAKDASAGKWFGNVTFGQNVEWKYAKELRDTLEHAFLSPYGGNYVKAFDLNDSDKNNIPHKQDIIAAFNKLAADIRSFRAASPQAPTMVIIGLTGHGGSAAAGYVSDATNYQMWVGPMGSDEHFTGAEMAGLLKGIIEAGADEVIVMVQSCFSGAINSDLSALGMQKFVQSLRANDGGQDGRTFTVITPANELFSSPGSTWEKIVGDALKPDGPGDYITYKQFKERLIYGACASSYYRPREAALAGLTPWQRGSLVGLAAAVLDDGGYYSEYYPDYVRGPLSNEQDAENTYWQATSGIDPQFYEQIDGNLPLLLTAAGLEKWQNNTLQLPAAGKRSTNVEVSSAVISACDSRKKLLVPLVQKRQQELVNLAIKVTRDREKAENAQNAATKFAPAAAAAAQVANRFQPRVSNDQRVVPFNSDGTIPSSADGTTIPRYLIDGSGKKWQVVIEANGVAALNPNGSIKVTPLQ